MPPGVIVPAVVPGWQDGCGQLFVAFGTHCGGKGVVGDVAPAVPPGVTRPPLEIVPSALGIVPVAGDSGVPFAFGIVVVGGGTLVPLGAVCA